MAADETFVIGFETEGDGQAQAAFENLKLKQMAAAAEAAKLSAELRKLQQSGEGTEQEMEELARAYVRAQQQAQKLGQEASRLSQAQTGAATSAAGLGTAATSVGQKLGQVGSAMGNVGAVLGRVSPQLGTAGQLFGQLGSAATGMSGAMGPVGVAVAAVTTAVSLAAPAIEALTQELDQNARAAAATRHSIEELAQAYRSVEDEQAQFAGTAPAETIRESLSQAEAAANELERRIAPTRERFERLAGMMGQEGASPTAVLNSHGLQVAGIREAARALEELEPQLRATEQRVERLREGLSLAESSQGRAGRSALPGEPELEDRGAAVRAAREREEQQRAAAERDRQRQGNAAAQAAQRELERKRLDGERAASEIAIDIVREEYERREELARAHTDMLVAEARFRAEEDARINREVDEAIQREMDLDEREADRAMAAAVADRDRRRQEREEQEEETRKFTEAQWKGVTDTVGALAGEMFSYLISGNEQTGEAYLALLDSFLEATAVQYTIKALAEVAETAAAAARYDPVGVTQHATAAGLAAAVAAATGIAGAAIQTPSASGNSSAPATAEGVGGGAALSPTNVTIQLFAPHAMLTEAERGQMISNATRAARREFGPSAVRP